MARYAQFTAESFAARTKPAPPPMPASGGDYGSLLVVRVGRPKKRPVLMLDPAEAAAEAIRFQQVAAHDFANPDEAIGRGAVLRLSALAANESGLEAEDDRPEAELAADEALALWTSPAEPVDATDWNDGAQAEVSPRLEAEPEIAVQAFAEPDAAAAEPVFAADPQPAFEPFFIERAEPAEAAMPAPLPGAGAEPRLAEADPEARPGLWRRIGVAWRAFIAGF